MAMTLDQQHVTVPGGPTLAEFELEVRSFLEAHAQPRAQQADARWGEGPDDVSLPLTSSVPEDEERRQVAAALSWRRTCSEAGFGWLSGPPELGGRGLTSAHERMFVEIEKGFEVPDRAITRTGVNIIGPSLLAHGSERIRTQLLPRVHRGDVLLCQLFSEPDAGSDLANIATRAVRDGNNWVITGQKVWSSGAHYADQGLCVARTSSQGRKHEGLTAFLVDLHAPGVEVRRIRQMTGGAEFDEVYFTDVVVPDDSRVGEEGQGWAITLEVLMAERAAIGDESVPDDRLVRRAIELAQVTGRHHEPVVRDALMQAHIRLAVTRLLVERILGGLAPGTVAGPELSMAKLGTTEAMQALGRAVSIVLGPAMVADTTQWGTFAWSNFVLGVPGLRIGGGTDEVMRNTLGERVLGLPREPR